MSFPESSSPNSPEIPRGPGAEAVARLPEALGFIESPEMADIKRALINAIRQYDRPAVKELMTQYHQAAEAIIEGRRGPDFPRAQIGLNLATALIWLEGGQVISYSTEIWNARIYARKLKLDDIVEVLNTAYAEVEPIVEASEASGYIGPPTEEIIAVCKRELPPELHEELDLLYPLPPAEVLEEVSALIIGYDLEEQPIDFLARMGWLDSA